MEWRRIRNQRHKWQSGDTAPSIENRDDVFSRAKADAYADAIGTRLDNVLIDEDVPGSPGKVSERVFGSCAVAEMARQKGSWGVEVGPWDKAGQRRLAYWSPRPVPWLKEHRVEEEHVRREAGDSVEVRCTVWTPGVPSGQCFVTEVRYSFLAPERSRLEERTRLVLSYRLSWSRPHPLRGATERGVAAGMAQQARLALEHAHQREAAPDFPRLALPFLVGLFPLFAPRPSPLVALLTLLLALLWPFSRQSPANDDASAAGQLPPPLPEEGNGEDASRPADTPSGHQGGKRVWSMARFALSFATAVVVAHVAQGGRGDGGKRPRRVSRQL